MRKDFWLDLTEKRWATTWCQRIGVSLVVCGVDVESSVKLDIQVKLLNKVGMAFGPLQLCHIMTITETMQNKHLQATLLDNTYIFFIEGGGGRERERWGVLITLSLEWALTREAPLLSSVCVTVWFIRVIRERLETRRTAGLAPHRQVKCLTWHTQRARAHTTHTSAQTLIVINLICLSSPSPSFAGAL